MGVCICKSKSDIITRDSLQKALVSSIENDDLAGLQDLYDFFLKQGSTPYVMPALSIDDPIISIQGVELNALAFAFRHGRTEIAVFLIEKAGCSLSRMTGMYQVIGKAPLQILCEYGHIELLRYYLPVYMQAGGVRVATVGSFHESYEDLSIFADGNHRRGISIAPVGSFSTAVQKACERGHIEILRFLKSYSDKHGTVREIDIHAEDDKTGENCALISCRTGNLQMMRFLFEDCAADFSIKNKRKESALQMALLGAKRHHSSRYLECIKYLVEKVKVDVLYEYEETLLLIEDTAIEEYIQKKLFVEGVSLTKTKVEETYAVVNSRSIHPLPEAYVSLENRLKDIGPEFEIREIFKEEFNSKSYISSISPVSDLSRDFAGTPGFKEAQDLCESRD